MAIEFRCSCGFEMTAASAHAGLYARCPACGALVEVPGRPHGLPATFPEEPDEALGAQATEAPSAERSAPGPRNASSTAEPSAPVASLPSAGSPAPQPARPNGSSPQPASALICAACGETVDANEAVSCIRCHADYHLDCWHEKGGCAVPTCAAGPHSRRQVMHFRGQEERLKPCPVCGEMIPERARRCRYCGQFTDRGLRGASKKRFRYPRKTSYLAGISFLLGLLGIVFISLVGESLLLVPALLFPVGSLGIGIWALVDIHRAAGEKSGWWMSGIGLFLATVGLLTWLVNFVELVF